MKGFNLNSSNVAIGKRKQNFNSEIETILY